jgi:hypothetical protein
MSAVHGFFEQSSGILVPGMYTLGPWEERETSSMAEPKGPERLTYENVTSTNLPCKGDPKRGVH